MTDIIQSLIKRLPIFIMIAGVTLFIFGMSQGSDFIEFEIMIGDPVIRWAFIIIGVFLVAVGIYLEAKYNSFANTSKINSPQNETLQLKVTYRDAVKIGLIVSSILAITPALFGLPSSVPTFLCVIFPLCAIGASLSLRYFTKTRAGLWFGAVFGAFLVCFLFIVFLIYSLSHWTF